MSQPSCKPQAQGAGSENGEDEVIVKRASSEREPLLKHRRFANRSLLFADASQCHNIRMSCVAVHPKFVALGVLHQTVYVLDHNGVLKHKFLQQHSAKINQISFDEDGLFLASCADDGVVSIVGLSSEYKHTIAFDKQVKSVALHSRYTPAHAVVAVGTDQLLLVEERRLLPGKKRTVLYKAAGPISTMQWKNDLIAFADMKMVTVYDMNARNVVASVALDEESQWASYLPCSLYWKSNTNLLVGHGHCVKMLVVTPDEKQVSTVARNMFEGVFVCSVVPLSGDSDKDWKLAVLGYRDTLEGMKQGMVPPPTVLVVSPGWCEELLGSCLGENPEPIARDTLHMRGYQNNLLNEYHMACFSEEKKFLIVSPNDVIQTTPERDPNAYVAWLIERNALEKALQYIEDPSTEGLLNPQSRYKEIGIMRLFDLIKTRKFSEAAKRCPKILGPKDKQKWEEIMMMIITQCGNMSEIAPFVPTKDPVLSPKVYELVLRGLLQEKSFKLLDVIRNWPSTLYNAWSFATVLESKLCQVLAYRGELSKQQRERGDHQSPDSSSEVQYLLKVLAELDDRCGSYRENAASQELQYKHTVVFDLVRHRRLYGAVMENLIPFMRLNSKATVKLLVDLRSQWILEELEADGNETHCLTYVLEGLCLNAVHADYFEKVVGLCTELQPEGIQQILQSCIDTHLQKALRCQEMMTQRVQSEESKDMNIKKVEDAKKELEKNKELQQAHHEAEGTKASTVVEQTPGALLLQLEKKLQQAEDRARQVEIERDAIKELMHQAENALKKAEESAMAAEREAKEVLEQMIQQAEKAVNEANERTEAAEREASVTKEREEESRLRLAAMQQDIARMRELVTTALARAESAERRAHEAETRVQDVQGEQQYWLVKKDEVELTGQEVGAGAWAAVKIAHFRGLRVAAKCLHNAIITPHNCRLFMREMSIAAHVRHPNLVQFIGATLEGYPILLLELMSTSLRAQLGHGPLLRAQSKSICQDVAKALNYLHLMKPKEIIHRDISSANVLLEPSGTDTWKAKLSDYGSANFLQLINTVAPGGPAYAAPESLTPELQSPKMDVFSYGVLLMEIFVSEFPDPATRKDTMQRIQHPLIAGLVQQCLEMKPEDRPPMSYILQQLHDL